MNRRDLDRLLLMGTALAAGWPAWLRRAFGAEPRVPSAPSGEGAAQRWRQIVSAAHRRARQAGKPLLVFVIPALDEESGRGVEAMWERGRAFGELLTHGDDDALVTLALAEIVCAPMIAVRHLAPGLEDEEPLMVLLETDGPSRVRALDARLPLTGASEALTAAGQPFDWHSTFEQQRQSEDRPVDGRIAVLSRLLHEGLRATPRMLLERAAQSRARLGPAEGAAVAEAGPAQLHRMAAVLLAAAVASPARDLPASLRRIADAARVVVGRRRLPGSRWARGGDPLPEESGGFLAFLTADAARRSRS
jgi:hypothetical protein